MNPQTQMTNPPNDQVKMTNPPVEQAKAKMTKVRIIRDIYVKRLDRVIHPGTDEAENFEMTPDELREFCDTKFSGPLKHSGEIGKKSARRSVIARAMRMEDVRALEAARKLENDNAGKFDGIEDGDE